ncbi:SpaH/EbpB family LPXTG-anchored major pilin [Lacrimispora saccharolytica]|nr:SpaH/EbpB family LPXTG-anchored major pilin [Lacrimispora saccharolytica]
MKAKKVLAMLMASAMIMGTSVTAFAAGATANIQVNGVNDDTKITYVQVVEPDTKSPLGWKFVDEEETESPIADAFVANLNATDEDDAIQKLIALGKLETTANQYASAGTINSSSDLGAALTAVENYATQTSGVNRSTITGIDSAGLYVIKVTSEDPDFTYIPMLAYVEDTGSGNLQDVNVTAKGSNNVILKDLVNPDVDGSVSEGDEVPYTASVVYPYYSADDTEKEFSITDTLDNGTFKAGTLVVRIEGESDPLVAGTDYIVTDYADQSELTIDFSGTKYNADYAGKKVTIEYTAIVGSGNEHLKNDIETNLDPDGDSVTSDEVAVKVIKTEDDAETVISGAEFTIYEAVDQATEGYTTTEDVSVVTRDGQAVNNMTLYLKVADDVRTTGNDGTVTFVGLDADKTYYVKETNAPTGYQLSEYYYAVGTTTEAATSTDKVNVYNDFADLTVINENLSSLPSTGGIGTTIFTIGGCAIMVTAAGLYFATRKKTEK